MHYQNSVIDITRLRYFMFDPKTFTRQRRLWPGPYLFRLSTFLEG